MKKAIITKYNSEFFPYMVTWTIGSIKYYNAFTTKQDCIDYIRMRFGKVPILDKTK